MRQVKLTTSFTCVAGANPYKSFVVRRKHEHGLGLFLAGAAITSIAVNRRVSVFLFALFAALFELRNGTADGRHLKLAAVLPHLGMLPSR
jgi:hypothetical protein